MVGLMQRFSEKTHTSLSTSSLVGYPLHLVLHNFPAHFVDWYIRHGLTCVGFLPVSVDADQTPGSASTQFSSHAEEREVLKTLLHDAFQKIMGPFEDVSLKGFKSPYPLHRNGRFAGHVPGYWMWPEAF